MNPREEEIERELMNLYLAENESRPKRFSDMVLIWTKSLRSIPIEYLSECFEVASQSNKKFKTATRGQVLAAWNDAVSRRHFKGGDFSLDPARERGTYYTGESLPAIFVPDKMRACREKIKDGTISDQEAYEYMEFLREKFFTAPKLNESLQKQCRGISEEFPTALEHKAAIRLISAAAQGKVTIEAGYTHLRQILIEGKLY